MLEKGDPEVVDSILSRMMTLYKSRLIPVAMTKYEVDKKIYSSCRQTEGIEQPNRDRAHHRFVISLGLSTFYSS